MDTTLCWIKAGTGDSLKLLKEGLRVRVWVKIDRSEVVTWLGIRRRASCIRVKNLA